jgi:dTDP-glucose 4,6-dehydratase
MKLLITGGAGFIGSNFIRYIIHNYPEYQIINIDKLTYAGNLDNLKDISDNSNYSFVKGDICDAKLIEHILKTNDIDVIINFAAETHVDRSIKDADMFVRTNIIGTQVLLKFALKYNISLFIQISTDEVYGSLGTTGYFTEQTPLSPNSPYSATKASADMLVRAYLHTYNMPCIITRCSNNYGPYQFPEKFIPLMIINAIKDKPLPVYGDGSNIRDWIYVEDHCRAIDKVLHKGKPGEIYNIGGRSEMTNLEVAKLILRKLNKPTTLIKFVKDRPGHDKRYAVDITKIQYELNWQPEYTFVQGIDSTIAWYKNNIEWITRRIKS